MEPLARVEPHINLAIELSASTWLVAWQLPTNDKIGMHRMDAGDTATLLDLIRKLQVRVRAKLRCNEVTVASCFKAGRDGFWLHRFLVAHGVANYVLEPTSILVSRRARRAKTDRLDAQGPGSQPVAYIIFSPAKRPNEPNCVPVRSNQSALGLSPTPRRPRLLRVISAAMKPGVEVEGQRAAEARHPQHSRDKPAPARQRS